MMEKIYWEPWSLSDSERQKFESQYWNRDVQLFTDIEAANRVTDGYRNLYREEMPLDELRILDKKVRIVALYARDVDSNGRIQICEGAKEFAAELHQRFVDLAEAQEVKGGRQETF